MASAGPTPDDAYGPAVLREIARRCEADPGREVCGFVVVRGGESEVVPVPNAADRFHAEDPSRFPRTARESFVMEPDALLRILVAVEAAGARIAAVWHSHVEAGAGFSAKDRADAVVDGLEQVPGAEYLVLGLRAGKATEARRYGLEDGEWVERPLGSPFDGLGTNGGGPGRPR